MEELIKLKQRVEAIKIHQVGRVTRERYITDLHHAIAIIERLQDEVAMVGNPPAVVLEEVCWAMLEVKHLNSSPCYDHVDPKLWDTLRQLNPTRYHSIIRKK